MSLVTTPGLLLRAYDYSESSRILRFLTPGHGVVSLLAKGVRRRSARGSEPLYMFAEGSLTFAYREGRDLHTLRDFQPQGSSGLGRGSYVRLAAASLLAELLLVHSLEEGDPELYAWVRSSFEALGAADERAVPGRMLAGAWRMLALLGFPPELVTCVRCGALLGEGEGRGDLGEPEQPEESGRSEESRQPGESDPPGEFEQSGRFEHSGEFEQSGEFGQPGRLEPPGDRQEPDRPDRPLDPEEMYRLDIPAGGLLCPDCGRGSAMPRVGPSARRDLAELVAGRVPGELRFVQAHLSILERFSLHHLSPAREFRTFEPLRQLIGQKEQDPGVQR